jgi:hypothetical protein
MSFYSELADTATEMLTEFGQSVTVTSFELGEEDITTGVVPQIATEFTTVGVLLDFDYRNFGDTTVTYQSVSSSEKRLIASASKIIKAGDLITVDNAIYKAYVVKVVNPSGIRVIYDIWMQK